MLHRLCLVFSLLIGPLAFAQNQFGSIQGRVTDVEGQSIPGASITISSPSLIGGPAITTSSEDGSYRFPAISPGVYQVQAALQGFQTQVHDGIRLFVGNTASVDFVLPTETISEAITVIGEPVFIDTTTTASSHTVSAEVIDALPKPESITALLALTPGVGDDLVAYGASGEFANRMWIDGVDVNSPALGGLFAQYDYNWIQEAQVTGIGAPAEFGGYTGVVGNFVTRSGGNQFHGLVETFFQNENLVSTNTPDPGPESLKTYDVSAQIGGPIVKEKLWFFSGFEYPYTQTRPFGYDAVTTEKYSKFITKLTYKPNQNNTVQGFVHWNDYHLDGLGANSTTLPEATNIVESPEASWNLTWISLLSPKTTFEGRFGGFWPDREISPRSGDIPGHFDGGTRITSVNAISHGRSKRWRPQLNLSISHHAEDFLGSHDFKFGTQFERSHGDQTNGYNGGLYYYDYYGYPFYRYVSPIPGEGITDHHRFNFDNWNHRISSYVQDNWNLSDRLTLSLGLRWDHNRGIITDQGTVFKTDPVAPRIGFVWKLQESNSTVLKAHYGDYYDALVAGLFAFVSDADRGLILEFFHSETQEWIESSRQRIVSVADPGLKHPFVREFTFGVDQELTAGIAFGAHYIHREWKNILEDINVSAKYEPVPFVNPITGETIIVYNLVQGGEDSTLLTNPDGLFRKYDGVEFFLNSRPSDKLSVSASFVYSRIKGNAQNISSELGAFSPFLNDPNNLINFDGRLANDPTFAWKISGYYNFPLGVNAGCFFRHESGDTWTPTVRLPVELVSQGGRILGLPLGSNRLPATNLLDVRFEKQFDIASGQLGFAVDIFNLFNTATITGVEARFDLASGENPDFGKPTSFTDPRTIRLGARYSF